EIRAPQHRGTHALDSLAQATRIVGPRNRRRDRCEQRTERLAREWLRPYGEAPGRGAMSGQEQGVRNRSVDLGRLVAGVLGGGLESPKEITGAPTTAWSGAGEGATDCAAAVGTRLM